MPRSRPDSPDATVGTTGAASSEAVTPELADTVAAGPTGRDPAERTRIGRYRIVKRLGAGGMGVVWEATDPELGRGVAIKVMHDTGSMRLAERLRREAQALARLHHPNVVTVFDVGVDVAELYIVMQLVSGVTLDRAIAGRSQREIVELMLQAGRGLAAAHAAGIVHRDFKPTNILVDGGGTVRVTDFGLARATDTRVDAPVGDSLDTSMTRGDLVGTPAYMAPEQFHGGQVTHATDQFAFCVTLWEVLAGERPFPGQDFGSLREAVIGGKLRELPARIPRRVRAVLLRGLATNPTNRFRSMTELLAALAPRRSTRWIAAGVGGAALATGFAIFGASRLGADPCKRADAPADALWNPARREAVRLAIGTGADGALAILDERMRWWRAKRIDVCQAGQVSRDEAGKLERKVICLDRNLADIGAAIDALAGKLDPEAASRSAQIAGAGMNLDTCLAVAETTGPQVVPAMHDPTLYAEVAKATTDFEAGRYRAVIARAKDLSPKVRAAGDPEVAYAWFWHLGQSYDNLSQAAPAKDALREAAESIMKSGEDDLLATQAWAELAQVSAGAGDLKTVDNVLAMARAAASRAKNPQADVWVETATAQVAVERGEFTEAMAHCRQAIETAKRVPMTARSEQGEALACLVSAQLAAHDPAAIGTANELLALRTRLFGPNHPTTIEAMRMVATATADMGDRSGSQAMWDRVLAASEELWGKTSAQVMYVLRDRATAMTPGGAISTPQALADIKRAIAIADQVLPPGDPEYAAMTEALAYVESAFRIAGKLPAAELAKTYDRAIELYEKLDDPMGLARVLYNAADAFRIEDPPDCDHAVPLFRRAAKVAGDTGQKSRIEAASLGAIGACLGIARRWAEAETVLDQAIAQLDATGDRVFAAQNRWELADQLVKRGQAARGIAIAKQAVAQLDGLPSPATELRAEIEKWLTKR